MSGLLLCCGHEASARLTTLLAHLPGHVDARWPAPATCQQYHGEQWALAMVGRIGANPTTSDTGISAAHGVVLGLEGYITGHSLCGDALRQRLIADFLQHGENCVARWHGSFRVVIHHAGLIRIYADHVASRVLFYAQAGDGMLYCSHSAPLLAALPRKTLDGANLLQFLQAGRFFAGASLFQELRQLGPGSGQRLLPAGESPQPFVWYQYRISNPSPNLSADEILPELKTRLDRAMLAHWQAASTPALLLSGGVDSRYILNTLGQCLPRSELARLFTCLWGEPNPDPGSDAAFAAREAARHGVPFAFYPMQAPIEALFDTLFALQSGMTAQVFSHTDDVLWCCHLAGQGIGALIRGDECFGPNGAEVNSREQALARVGLSPIKQPEWLAGLTVDSRDWQQQHADWLAELAQQADEPNDLRDVLYCRERLPALNAHFNSQRAPFVENINPLLDPDLLELISQLPRHLRTDKRILRQCFARYYPTDGFASSGNGFNWLRPWQQPGLAGFIQRKLAALPAPFDLAYWQAQGQMLTPGSVLAASMDQASRIRAMQMISRVLVLGHWLNQN